MGFSPNEAKRYARHIVLKGIGGPGQQKLKQARVLVVGAGGLGSPVIAYLAGAGVGQISIADADGVSLSNLQRQIVHRGMDAGVNKAQSAARFANELNTEISVTAVPEFISRDNAAALVASHDIIIDGTDRFETRKMIADFAEAAKKPLISGGVSMFDGQITVFAPHLMGKDGTPNPRFADLYGEAGNADLPNCEEVGVLGPVTGVIGTLMAMEAIKLITGAGKPLIGRVLIYDGRDARFREMRYRST